MKDEFVIAVVFQNLYMDKKYKYIITSALKDRKLESCGSQETRETSKKLVKCTKNL